MIKASELRIGNYVQGITSRVKYKIDINNLKDVDAFKGIPLTNEILEKVGFVKGKPQSSGFYGYSNGVVMLDNDFSLSLFDGRMDDPETKEYCPEIKYLHQLQNLYFALIGEELNVKI